MQQKLLIFGTNTTAKAICQFIKNYNLFEIMGFTVDSGFYKEESFCGLPVFDVNKLDGLFNKKNDLIFVAIQWNKMNKDRKEVYLRLKNEGYNFANIISPSAIIHGKIIGDNCWISDYVIIDTNAQIDHNVFVKSKAYIANDCIIKKHSFIGANAFIAGGVVIGEESFVGISSTIFDDTKIGKKCLVGACSIVKRNLADYSIIKTKLSSELIQSNSDQIETKLIVNKNIR